MQPLLTAGIFANPITDFALSALFWIISKRGLNKVYCVMVCKFHTLFIYKSITVASLRKQEAIFTLTLFYCQLLSLISAKF